MAAQFGPSALATPANLVTIGRLVLTLPLLIVVLDANPSWFGFGLWLALALTDGVDGHMARRHGTTRSGAFLDPLADKVLVLGMLIALVVEGTFWWVPVAVIAWREVAIQSFRSYWARRGLAVPATVLAKAKTVVQQMAVGFALVPITGTDVTGLAEAVLWTAVALTVVTGVQYVVAGSRSATTAGSR